ncbi:MAG: ROK family protein [Bacteroidales bacterium]|nr:ROK family protein [Bacteroidales bacterium]
MNTQTTYAIGVDIGGQTTKIGLVDRHGNILSTDIITSNDTTDPHTFSQRLANAIIALIERHTTLDNVTGIGIGAPMGNYYTGCIDGAINLPWCNGQTIPLVRWLKELTGLSAIVTNDANAAAMGEMAYGIAKGMNNFIMVTLGTGVGSGIVVNGKVLYGCDGYAGELGHVIVERHNGRSCGCGRSGCLETYTSARGIERSVREWLTATNLPSLLRQKDIATITSKDIYEAAVKGDKLAKDAFALAGEKLGEAFANFVAFSSLEAIILFGGVTKAKDFFYPSLMEHMEKNLISFWKGKVKVLFSILKESDAAILGASALAWEIKHYIRID